ncbi:MAG: hypothetical protein R3F04_15575 [Lysobacteraceae bacterium]
MSATVWMSVSLLLIVAAFAVWWAEREGRRHRARLAALDNAWLHGLLDDATFLARRKDSLTQRPLRAAGPGLWVLGPALVLPFAAALLWQSKLSTDAPAGAPVATMPGAPSGVASSADSAPRARSMDEVLASLSTRLQRDGGSVDDWLLLGRGYASQGKFSEAEAALRSAHAQAPERLDVEVEWIEARAKQQGRFAAEDQARLVELAAQDPSQAKPLWLLAELAEQSGDTSSAAQRWNEVLALLPTDSPDRAVVMQRLGRQDATSQPTVSSADQGLQIDLQVAAGLADGLSPQATVFIFARSPDSPMPVAAHRITLGELPATIHLDDRYLIQPGRSLSSYGPLLVGARVSVSGDARPASGDIEAELIRVESLDSGNRLSLALSKIRP